MKYNIMNVTFWYNEVEDFKKYRNILDEELNGIFGPFNLTGVPSNVDPIIPRIISNTVGGHTSFNMSKINVQLSTHFDGEYIHDFDKCINYVKEKALRVFNILTEKCNFNVLYSSVFINCEYEEKKPVEKIVKDIFKMDFDDSKLAEIGVRITEIVDDKYYFITSINDAKVVSYTKKIEQTSKPQNIIIPLISEKELNIEKKVIAYAIEINDKCSYNVKDEYFSTKETLDEIIDICSTKINELDSKVISENDI